MDAETAILELWKIWTENAYGLDFETWLDKHGKTESEKLAKKLTEPEVTIRGSSIFRMTPPTKE